MIVAIIINEPPISENILMGVPSKTTVKIVATKGSKAPNIPVVLTGI